MRADARIDVVFRFTYVKGVTCTSSNLIKNFGFAVSRGVMLHGVIKIAKSYSGEIQFYVHSQNF